MDHEYKALMNKIEQMDFEELLPHILDALKKQDVKLTRDVKGYTENLILESTLVKLPAVNKYKQSICIDNQTSIVAIALVGQKSEEIKLIALNQLLISSGQYKFIKKPCSCCGEK